MEIDQELLQASIEVISEFPNKLPLSSRQSIAQRMLKKDRLGDESWCKQAIANEELKIAQLEVKAKKKGYYPFIFVGIGAYRWICKNYGKWTVKLMEEKLQSPVNSHRLWAIQFAAAMALIGEEECKQQTNLYEFVTQNEKWEKAHEERKKWLQYARSLQKKKPKAKEEMH